jgi:hypothetical protein
VARSEDLYGLFLEVQATCRLLYRDLEVAVDELVTVRAEAEARLERLKDALGWAEQLARAVGREEVLQMGLDMEEKESEHVVLGGRGTGKLDAAIARAQARMSNPGFDSKNPHFKNEYASLAAVRNAVVPAFSAEGVACTQHPTAADGKLRLVTRLAGYGEVQESILEMALTKSDPQSVGSCITYARRYALLAVGNVVGDSDDDASAAMPAKASSRPVDASGPPKATTPAQTPQKPSTGQPEAPTGTSGLQTPEDFDRAIAAAPTLKALGDIGTALATAPREVRDWCRDKFQQKMNELGKKESKK